MSDQKPDLDFLADVVTRCAGAPTTASVLAADPSFDDLGVDSLGRLGIVAEMENHLKISLPDGAEEAHRPSDLLALVHNRLERRP